MTAIGGWKTFKRGDVFYLRVYLRTDLSRQLGRREVWRSLGTGDRREANERAPTAYIGLCQQLFEGSGAQLGVMDTNLKPTLFPNSSRQGLGENSESWHNERPSLSLSELIKQFKEVHKDGWRIKTKISYEAMHREFKSYFGPATNVRAISRKKCQQFRTDLMTVPPNFRKRYEFKDHHIGEIAANIRNAETHEDDVKLVSIMPRTCNRYLSHLKQIFRWAYEESFLDEDPAKGIRMLKRNSLADCRRSFTIDELNSWFNAEFHKSGDLAEHDFWLSMVLMYSGIRLGEGVQLVVSDLVTRNNILAIEISDRNVGDFRREVKSANANRIIPIHRDLLNLGLLRYVEKCRHNDFERLFPENDASYCDTLSDGPSKRLNRHLRVLGMPKEIVVHSFRHTFRDASKTQKSAPV